VIQFVETNRPLCFHELNRKLLAAPLYVCFYSKATDTFTAFPQQQQWFRESLSMLRHTHIACLVTLNLTVCFYCLQILPALSGQMFVTLGGSFVSFGAVLHWNTRPYHRTDVQIYLDFTALLI
jgi:hypothetical protein